MLSTRYFSNLTRSILNPRIPSGINTLYSDQDFVALSGDGSVKLDTCKEGLIPVAPKDLHVAGIGVFARHKIASEFAADRLRVGQFWRRNFHVLIFGELTISEQSGSIKIPLIEKEKGWIPSSSGLQAFSHWRVLRKGDVKELEFPGPVNEGKVALLDIAIEGAIPVLSQLRAHMKLAFNANIYRIGGKLVNPPFLYCHSLSFAALGGDRVDLEISSPQTMDEIYKRKGWLIKPEIVLKKSIVSRKIESQRNEEEISISKEEFIEEKDQSLVERLKDLKLKRKVERAAVFGALKQN